MAEMLDFKERSRLRRFLYAKPTIILLALIAIGLSHAVWGMYQKYDDAAEKRERAEQDLQRVKERIAALEANIARLSTERGVEEVIRDRFMVAKDDEKVLVITDPPQRAEHTVIVVPEEEKSIFQKLQSALGLGE